MTIVSPTTLRVVNGRSAAPARAKWSITAEENSCAVTANRIALPTPNRGARKVMLRT